jgi:hypothetical protein
MLSLFFLFKSLIMKLRIFILAAGMAMLAACGSTYRATDQTTVVVPAGTQTAFVTQYPTASNTVWTTYDQVVVPLDWDLTGWNTLDAGDYVVRFDMDNEKYYAWYDTDGTWIGTAYVVNDYKLLPDAVNTTINNQFSGYTITNVTREFQKDRVAYEIQLKNGDTKAKLLVDANGNIIKQKTKVQ